MVWIDIVISIFVLLAVFLAFSGTTIGDSDLAFGGDRWTDSSAPLYRRITARGWASILCLSVAIGFAVNRESIEQNALQKAANTITGLEEDAGRLHTQVAKYVKDIVKLQKQVKAAQRDLSGVDDNIKIHQLLSIEAAFKLSTQSLQESDEAIVHLDGRARIPIPSRQLAQMRLVGGDRFYMAAFVQKSSSRDLQSILLKIGEKTFPLFKGGEKGFSEKTLRLPGNPFNPIPAVILNPLLLNNLTMKIIIYPKEVLQEEDAFKKLINTSPFSAPAKEIYKVTTADMLNVRLEATSASRLVARLRRGSYVRVLQRNEDWVGIRMPKGNKGWVINKFLTEIE